MAESETEAAEAQLAESLGELRERIAGEDSFAVDLYRGLTNRRWRRTGTVISLSWGRVEELINEQRRALSRDALELRQTGGEGELSDDVEEELSLRGWSSEPLNTGRHDEAHASSGPSPPPPGTGERQAPTAPPEAARRAHDEADAGERLFPRRPGESGAKAGRDPQERQ